MSQSADVLDVAVVLPWVIVRLLRVSRWSLVTPKMREALLPLMVMPSASALASMVRAAVSVILI